MDANAAVGSRLGVPLEKIETLNDYAKSPLFTEAEKVALEYADANIRVNAVCPGFIKTQMTEETMRRRGAAIMAQIPLRRMGEPGEIAEMVVWLCSDRASYVTGASYNVDGGWMAV